MDKQAIFWNKYIRTKDLYPDYINNSFNSNFLKIQWEIMGKRLTGTSQKKICNG